MPTDSRSVGEMSHWAFSKSSRARRFSGLKLVRKTWVIWSGVRFARSARRAWTIWGGSPGSTMILAGDFGSFVWMRVVVEWPVRMGVCSFQRGFAERVPIERIRMSMGRG